MRQAKHANFITTAPFVVASITGWVFVSEVPEEHYSWYYAGSALMYLIAMRYISLIRPLTEMVVKLQYICFAGIGLNVLGALMWWSYLSADVYNASFILLYLFALCIVAGRGGINVIHRPTRDDSGGANDFIRSGSRSIVSVKYSG